MARVVRDGLHLVVNLWRCGQGIWFFTVFLRKWLSTGSRHRFGRSGLIPEGIYLFSSGRGAHCAV
jgi:hypothetical protein